jgi:hypothetical protein
MNRVRVERIATPGGLQALDLETMYDSCGNLLSIEASVLYSKG